MELRLTNSLHERARQITVKLDQESIEIDAEGGKMRIPREEIKNISLFRSRAEYCMRIASVDNCYELVGIHEMHLTNLKTKIAQLYGITVDMIEQETFDTLHGNLIYSNSTVMFQGKNQILGIPKSQIQKVTELEDELEFCLPGAEIVFSTTSNVTTFLESHVSEEICILQGVNCINPRSRCALIFFKDYLILKGSSYDHTILYDDVQELFFLARDAQHYIVVKLANYVVQGQTKYHSLVFLVGDKEVEVAAKDSRLKASNEGDQAEVLLSIMEALFRIRAQESPMSIKCTSKVFDGYLYLLDNSIQFLPKPISIPLKEISHVEFSRINLSVAQAKTFDLAIFSDKMYSFTGIQKDAFGGLETYFHENNIRIVSEIIEESISKESSEEGDESDLSDLVDSADE